MEDGITGLVAVTMFFAVPLGGMFTYYRIRKLRTEEKLAAMARGVDVPMEPELSQAALVAGALGYMIAFALIARTEPEVWKAVAFGVIPLALGLGFFLDATLVRRDLHA